MQICQVVTELTKNHSVFFAKWIKVYGIIYRPEMFLVIGIFNDLPVFGKIIHVLAIEDTVLRIVEEYKTFNFDRHRYAYKIQNFSEKMRNQIPQDLLEYKPLNSKIHYLKMIVKLTLHYAINII